MNYEIAGEKYTQLRQELEAIEREFKAKKAAVVSKINVLENWFTAKAQEDGLKTIPTQFGTAYWSTHHSATVASREDFFDYCREYDMWDLLESRASKTAVKSFIESHGEPPPGVNYSTVSVFNFRKPNSK